MPETTIVFHIGTVFGVILNRADGCNQHGTNGTPHFWHPAGMALPNADQNDIHLGVT